MAVIKVIGLGQLNELKQHLNELTTTPAEVVKPATLYAKQIAPSLSGALRNGIRYIIAPNKKQATIRSGLPNNKDGRKRPYNLWINGLGKYNLTKGWKNWRTGEKHYIKTGKVNYMYLTADKVSKDIDAAITKKLNKL